ncbi:hypothetical protein VOLCADRAFT_94429 [Volvox carteri f. nagariensis]|uniref:Uncharacterized protein n=1 Tax=Volvox carteri f. nagariensis TaxID=3068 RepID=D8U4S4_VOLCA|nr:uncharacterized protein VOLCADRAFT_94429 [Volvox carteri f. nagariensis]EFJ45325.1 hypothetical protein VOLCADRAFT_94429 [Volvox carteri f. nagariensis]|eukprot:XP_002953701.1 hypothetical protein VOLCADRAFT_94429 [Volvox carteri f. nagariensis]
MQIVAILTGRVYVPRRSTLGTHWSGAHCNHHTHWAQSLGRRLLGVGGRCWPIQCPRSEIDMLQSRSKRQCRRMSSGRHHLAPVTRVSSTQQPRALSLLLVATLFFAGPSTATLPDVSFSSSFGNDAARDEHEIIKYKIMDVELDSGPELNAFDNYNLVSGTPRLQGGSRRLHHASVAARQQQQQQQPAAVFEMGSFDAPLISIALTHVPTAGTRSRKYFAYWRADTSNQTQAATFDLNTRKRCSVASVKRRTYHRKMGASTCTGTRLTVHLTLPHIEYPQLYNEGMEQFSRVGSLSFQRWYPTPCMVSGNKVLVVGGTARGDKGPPIPVAELWDPRQPSETTVSVPLPPAFKKAAGNNWYPFIALLPRGEVLWWGDRGGSITNKDWQEIHILPDLPESFPYRTMYWYTSSIVLNAMKPDSQSGEYNDFSMTIFGGALGGAKPETPASPASARLDMYYCGNKICDKGWVIENMAGQRRVMPTTTVLPNGKVLIHGGGQAGTAGWRKKGRYQGTLPAYQDLVYDPDAPEGSRYKLSTTVGIIHMYHASSCLDLSGKVMSAGCDTCGMTGADAGNLPSSVSRSPHGDLDYRISFAVPAEIAPPVERPVIRTAPKVILLGRVFTVGYKYGGPITGATLAAPCANTHSINMNQRVVFLNVIEDDGTTVALRAPPLSQPSAAHAGYYQLFLLGANTATGRTYSEGVWIYLADE